VDLSDHLKSTGVPTTTTAETFGDVD
jgi:hypothetical protein